jgi:hypothetical protein
MHKFYPHKGCSCRMCRRGKHGTSGQFITNQVERRFRREAKLGLALDPYNFDTAPSRTGYTD